MLLCVAILATVFTGAAAWPAVLALPPAADGAVQCPDSGGPAVLLESYGTTSIAFDGDVDEALGAVLLQTSSTLVAGHAQAGTSSGSQHGIMTLAVLAIMVAIALVVSLSCKANDRLEHQPVVQQQRTFRNRFYGTAPPSPVSSNPVHMKSDARLGCPVGQMAPAAVLKPTPALQPGPVLKLTEPPAATRRSAAPWLPEGPVSAAVLSTARPLAWSPPRSQPLLAGPGHRTSSGGLVHIVVRSPLEGGKLGINLSAVGLELTSFADPLAIRFGFSMGDRIIKVNGTSVSQQDDFLIELRKAVERFEATGEPLHFDVLRSQHRFNPGGPPQVRAHCSDGQ